jgi:hypothetical protein
MQKHLLVRLVFVNCEDIVMANVEKKKAKLIDRIKLLETEVFDALKKKSSSQTEINVPAKQRQIAELRQQLSKL